VDREYRNKAAHYDSEGGGESRQGRERNKQYGGDERVGVYCREVAHSRMGNKKEVKRALCRKSDFCRTAGSFHIQRTRERV